MTPLLLLDVDGVLNVLGEGAPWEVLNRGHAVAEGTRYPITWAPEVVDALRGWRADGRVEIQWLTTWGHDANRSLRKLLNLPELVVAGTYRDDNRPHAQGDGAGRAHASVAPAAPDPLTGGWWKYDVMQRLILEHPGRPLIWVDDELHVATQFRAWAFEHPDVHPIGPDGSHGLTPHELEVIASLL